MDWKIHPVDGGYQLLTEGRSPYPENPYTVWWPKQRAHADGTQWGTVFTRDEILKFIEELT